MKAIIFYELEDKNSHYKTKGYKMTFDEETLTVEVHSGKTYNIILFREGRKTKKKFESKADAQKYMGKKIKEWEKKNYVKSDFYYPIWRSKKVKKGCQQKREKVKTELWSEAPLFDIAKIEGLKKLHVVFRPYLDEPLAFSDHVFDAYKTLEKLYLEYPYYGSGHTFALQNIPSSIQSLDLKELSLYDLDLQEANFDFLSAFPKLNYLSLKRMNLTEIPESVRALKALKYLDLSENKLAELPQWIGELNQLETLYLKGNLIKEIPQTVGQLKTLKNISLANNHLEALPACIKNLSQLEVLHIGENKITELPNWIGDLDLLKEINLRNLKIWSLPESFGKLFELEKLEIPQTKIDINEVPPSFFDLCNLIELNASWTPMKTVPKEIVQLDKLKVLDIMLTPIYHKKTIPYEILRSNEAEKIIKYLGYDNTPVSVSLSSTLTDEERKEYRRNYKKEISQIFKYHAKEVNDQVRQEFKDYINLKSDVIPKVSETFWDLVGFQKEKWDPFKYRLIELSLQSKEGLNQCCSVYLHQAAKDEEPIDPFPEIYKFLHGKGCEPKDIHLELVRVLVNNYVVNSEYKKVSPPLQALRKYAVNQIEKDPDYYYRNIVEWGQNMFYFLLATQNSPLVTNEVLHKMIGLEGNDLDYRPLITLCEIDEKRYQYLVDEIIPKKKNISHIIQLINIFRIFYPNQYEERMDRYILAIIKNIHRFSWGLGSSLRPCDQRFDNGPSYVFHWVLNEYPEKYNAKLLEALAQMPKVFVEYFEVFDTHLSNNVRLEEIALLHGSQTKSKVLFNELMNFLRDKNSKHQEALVWAKVTDSNKGISDIAFYYIRSKASPKSISEKGQEWLESKKMAERRMAVRLLQIHPSPTHMNWLKELKKKETNQKVLLLLENF